MNWCIICENSDHQWDSVGAHTDEEKAAYVKRILEYTRSKTASELRHAYDLIAKDIKKRPRNILKLTKRLQKLRGK